MQKCTHFQVVLGMVEDEATDLFFGQKQVEEGIGPDTRDQYLRTLIRNTYNYHMNEIFATVQNEYIDWSVQGPLETEPPIRPRHLQMSASSAITDKLYLAPLLRTANWCNLSAFETFFYVYSYCDTSMVIIKISTGFYINSGPLKIQSISTSFFSWKFNFFLLDFQLEILRFCIKKV